MGEGEERGTEREFVIFTYQEKKVKEKLSEKVSNFLFVKMRRVATIERANVKWKVS